MQYVIPGENLNFHLKGKYFIYKNNCRPNHCTHVHHNPNLKGVLRYMNKNDVVN